MTTEVLQAELVGLVALELGTARPAQPRLGEAVAPGRKVAAVRGLSGLAGAAGPDPTAVVALLGSLHACRPSCRLNSRGELIALEELPAGTPVTLDLDDLLWELPPGMQPPHCPCTDGPSAPVGFAHLPPAEQLQRLQAGRTLPHLVVRELQGRQAEEIFLGEEYGRVAYADARVVLLPAPVEATVSYGHGTSEGPAALIEASGQVELFDEECWVEHRPEVHTLPFPVLPPDAGDAVAALRALATGPVADGKLLMTLGGEHSLSVGPIAAVAERWPDLAVLHFDAHLDLRDQYEGNPYSHASVMRRVVDDLGLPVVAVGIRSFSAAEAQLVWERGYKPFFAHALDPAGHYIGDLIARLPQHVYVSLDLDVLDPAEFPGTGTPEPGGMRYREVLAVLRRVAQTRTIVGVDLVELAPLPGSTVSQFCAARIAAKIVVYTGVGHAPIR